MYAMLINGEMVTGSSGFDVIDPATENVLGQAPVCTEAQLTTAIESAHAALGHWQSDIESRRKVLEACADVFRANADELASLLSAEQGKPVPRARYEIMGAASWFAFTAGMELPVEVLKDDELARVEVHREPVGVVAAIAPWNYPLMTLAWKLAPALLAGNTLVFKPSPFTPLATLAAARLLQSIIPAGVVSIVTGGDELGKAMVAHPLVRKVSFTGSTEAGCHVAQSAAAALKRVTLELGGNDPAIVLPGVDVAAVAQKIFTAGFENTGQVCAAIKRVYVHKSISTEFTTALVELAKAAVVGDGRDEATTLGPINNRPQFERVVSLVESARALGGEILCGGERIGNQGYFYAPTIVTGLADDAPLVAEEQFGPALPVLEFDELDDVIKRANDTSFGLSASVWGEEADARKVASQLQAGTVWVNQHLAIIPQAPICGVKLSGLGVENGRWGLESYTQIKTISMAKPQQV